METIHLAPNQIVVALIVHFIDDFLASKLKPMLRHATMSCAEIIRLLHSKNAPRSLVADLHEAELQ